MLFDKLKANEATIKELTALGLINPTWLRNLEVFELYQSEINKGQGVYDAYMIVSMKIKPQLSWQSVKRIVYELSK